MWLELLTLFWIFFKIGLFTFGGGYAMIPLIEILPVCVSFLGDVLPVPYDVLVIGEEHVVRQLLSVHYQPQALVKP